MMAGKRYNNITGGITLLLYGTLTHTHLERCVWFWYLQLRKEKLQQKAAAVIGMDPLPCEKLKMVGHFSWESRRLKVTYG